MDTISLAWWQRGWWTHWCWFCGDIQNISDAGVIFVWNDIIWLTVTSLSSGSALMSCSFVDYLTLMACQAPSGNESTTSCSSRCTHRRKFQQLMMIEELCFNFLYTFWETYKCRCSIRTCINWKTYSISVGYKTDNKYRSSDMSPVF